MSDIPEYDRQNKNKNKYSLGIIGYWKTGNTRHFQNIILKMESCPFKNSIKGNKFLGLPPKKTY